MTTNATIDPRRRSPLLLALTLLCLVAAAAGGAWYWLIGRYYEHTDDAYVNAHVVQVTSQTTGTVREIKVQDTDRVAAGQLLIELDPTDAALALDAAEAALAHTVRQVNAVYATNGTLQADLAAQKAALARAQTEAAKAQDDYATRAALVATGAVGKEELKHAEAAVGTARAAVAATRAAIAAAAERLATNRTLTAGVDVRAHPEVQQAIARVREAYLARARTRILAPLAGDVAQRAVQIGQRVQPGEPLLSVVPLSEVWVDANFKEGQLRQMRVGQPAKLVADLYGDRVGYDGHIVGFGAGTGAAFALLPAQNASGNWIKIVQRVPVRIALDPEQLAAHPLRVGLSMDVTIDLHEVDGDAPLDAPAAEHVSRTTIFDEQLAAVEQRIDEIVQDNLAARAAPATATASAH